MPSCFDYYHPEQHSSASMKAVLPALTGRGYEELEIHEGGTASLEFLRVTFGEVAETERQRVRQALEQYCGRDTEGMIWSRIRAQGRAERLTVRDSGRPSLRSGLTASRTVSRRNQTRKQASMGTFSPEF